MGSQVAQEWADLATASGDETYVPEEDPMFQEDINRLCNVGLKAMLRDESREVSEWQDELNKVVHMRYSARCDGWILHRLLAGGSLPLT